MAYKCKNCGKFVAKDAAVCKHCGQENPAVLANSTNNVSGEQVNKDTGSSDDSCQIDLQTEPPAELCDISARVLRQGDLGRDVFLLQCGLNDMGISCGVPDGDFGLNTVEAVRELQRKIDQEPTGIADQNVWMAVMKKR